MGGASTALALEPLGANFWNPAVISGLSQSQIAIGSQLTYPIISVNSQIRGQGGTTWSESGMSMIPGLALVYRNEDMPRLTLGSAMFAAAGGGVNFPGDPTNPIFAPTGPLGNLVLGPNFANIAILQLVNNASFQVTDKLAVGAGVVTDYCMVGLDPAIFAPPDDANGDGVSTFPSATHARPFWGAGFKLGGFYHLSDTIDIGFGYTSKQWLETWTFNSRDEIGNAQKLALRVTLPPIYSWGIAYKGIEKLILSSDFRLINYKNSRLFGTPIVDGGMGWQNVFAAAMGAQYAVSEKTSVRLGYIYNTAPIPTAATLFNIQAPAITQNTISAGLTTKIDDNIDASLGYAYGFPNTLTGTLLQLPGTNISMRTSTHSLLLGLNIRFGTPKQCDAIVPAASTQITDASIKTLPVEPVVPKNVIATPETRLQ